MGTRIIVADYGRLRVRLPRSLTYWRMRLRNAKLRRIGVWFEDKWRQRAADSGHYAAATAMRKQGVPLEMARLVLLGRAS